MADFVHLHLHSEYSLLDGALRVRDIPKAAREMGQSAVALTDHGSMYGVVEFYEACKKEEIKPIIGCEVYVAQKSRFDKNYQRDQSDCHLTLLCENETGYKNLIKMVSLSFTEGFYMKPRVDLELLEKYHEGLIALSGCLAGNIPRLLMIEDYEGAKKYAQRLNEIFGKDRFYIEIQNHSLADEKRILPMLARLSSEISVPLVATNDVHYRYRDDAFKHAVLLCVQMNKVISDGRPIGYETDEFYFKSAEEMEKLFSDYDGALENTKKIADMCCFDFEFGKTVLPRFDVPAGKSPEELLREMVLGGLDKKCKSGDIVFDKTNTEKAYLDRIEYELRMICKMGYAEYFLITQDFVNFAKNANIPVGPGRGSGAGSIVSYLIGITDVDPIKYDLMFERFLNPERVSMPDLDIDFCYDRRLEVINYVSEKYGKDRVCQIITFGTLAARAAIRDVGRALGLSYQEVDAVAKLVPHAIGMTIADAIKAEPKLKALYDSDDTAKRLCDIAMSLEGMPRHMSTHASGVVISDRPVYEYVPLAVSGDVPVTQFDMDTLSHLGLLKFDFLGLRYLTIISNTEKMIRRFDKDFDIQKVPFDDKATFKMISEGRTLGVFQLEKPGMRKKLLSFKPDTLDDIVAVISLYRPGPMESIPAYIENKKHPENIKYPTEKLRDILKSTNGCIVYQEQVMQICRTLAGYSLGRADVIRRMMAKKKTDEMAKEREIFVGGLTDENGNTVVPGAVKNGVPADIAYAIFDRMAEFAKYAYNESHAVSYALTSYRTAYLKAHYPAEYICALMNSVIGDDVKIAEYVADAEKMGIELLPPSVNESFGTFEAVTDKSTGKKAIRFGLLGVRNVGRTFIDNLVAERENGLFESFEDFIGRMSKRGECNRRMIEGLIKCGSCDEFGRYRSELNAASGKLIDEHAAIRRGNLDGQTDMFSMAASDPTVQKEKFRYPRVPDFSQKEKLDMEKESTGLCFSGHLLDPYAEDIESIDSVSAETILSELSSSTEYESDSSLSDGESVNICGIVGKKTEKSTKSGKKMLFFMLEDRYAEIEIIVFPDSFAKYQNILTSGEAVCVFGDITLKDDEAPKIILKNVRALLQNGSAQIKRTQKPSKKAA
ncbi:MAG: DNA polymerase III subunit alpha, partial [Clostridia bacterium]|nr:DNA polymerase III subunit alpha [Clostridia bacterium]